MKRKLLLGSALGALVLAALAPWSASRAQDVSLRVNTPHFAIRIGAPHFPVYQPVPVYQPAPVYYPQPVYAPPPVIYAPPPVVYAPPRYYGPPAYVVGYRGYPHRWQHGQWQNDRQWQNNRRWDGYGWR
ncbi:MAG: hypothetical protein ABJA83_03975 [Burkholderiaceae bacterium]